MALTLTDDYVGFTYNGFHSSDLGIVRTSNGSRYSQNLLPTSQDKTAVRTGADGTMYWGSNYTQTPFSVSYAFDSLTEKQLSQLKVVFGDKGVHDLIFDETPYKVYKAKVTGTAQLEYLAFDEGEVGRIYKGNGTIQFTCFQPYARSRFKFLDETEYENEVEWAEASRMKDSQTYQSGNTMLQYDVFNASNRTFNLYNAGDIPTDFKLIIPFDNAEKCTSISIKDAENKIYGDLGFSGITKKTGDSYIMFNSAINLIEGLDEHKKKTGRIYNEFLTKGDFFQIPQGEMILDISFDGDINFDEDSAKPTIEYDYLYY